MASRSSRPDLAVPSRRRLAALGAMALAGLVAHHGARLVTGEVQHLLWLSSVATLVLAAGCLLGRGWPVGLALVWLAVDAAAWTLDVTVGGGVLDSATFTHAGSFVLAVLAARELGPPRRGTWLVATAGLVALVGAARLWTPAADNLNFAFAAAPGWEHVTADHGRYLALVLALAAAGFLAAEWLARRPWRRAGAVLDHLLVPGLLAATVLATHALLVAGTPPLAVSTIVVFAIAGVAAVLERVRPERDDHRPLDQPFATELAHFLFNYNLGYGLALAAVALVGVGIARLGVPSPWPADWPLAAQVLLGVLLAEVVSYWQHRLFHRVPWLWPFHALHHAGERLNLVRAARFHAVDIGPGAFLVFVPLVLVQAPPVVVTWLAALAGPLGILQHANLRVRTPPLLDRLLCTPAVHRFHHSVDHAESDANFGTTLMIFDRVFGTYRAPTGPGPAAVGITGPRLPAGFWRQALSPFRR